MTNFSPKKDNEPFNKNIPEFKNKNQKLVSIPLDEYNKYNHMMEYFNGVEDMPKKINIINSMIIPVLTILGTICGTTWFISSSINSSSNEVRKEIMAFSQSEKVEIGNRISKVEDHIIRVEDKITKVDEKVSNEFKEINKNINEIRILLINKEHTKSK